jgi:hypothetical protein
VVDWGQKHPVIYTMGGNRLNGEWADGSASEDLALFARAAETSVLLSAGRYRVAGRNPNGSRYTGTVSIAVQGGGYQLDWRVGSSGYRGSGTLVGNLLTVDWGSSTPVIYALAPHRAVGRRPRRGNIDARAIDRAPAAGAPDFAGAQSGLRRCTPGMGDRRASRHSAMPPSTRWACPVM